MLLGRLQGIRDGTIVLAPDLAENLAWGDEQARTSASDRRPHSGAGVDAPTADPPDDLRPVADLARGAGELDLAGGIGTVIWATGYRPDLGWVRLPFLDCGGVPGPAARGDGGARAVHPRS